MQEFILSTSPWYIVLCLALGAVVAAILYYRSKYFEDKSPIFKGALSILRWFAVSAIAFLLLQPLVRLITTQEKAPKVLLFLDKSQSVLNAVDSSSLENLKGRVAGIAEAAEADLEVYYLGSSASQEWSEVSDLTTDLSKVASIAYQEYANENIAAIILASDGLYNRGQNPLYIEHAGGIAIHTIGLGDTTVRKDLGITNVFFNEIAYKGDKMEIEVDVKATNANEEQVRLQIYTIEGNERKAIESKSLSIQSDDDFKTESFTLDLNEPGVRQYRAVVTSLDGETSTANNRQDFFIRVIDTRKKIALLARNPHPDLSALKQLLTASKNYEIEILDVDKSIPNPDIYDLFILHQMPSKTKDGDPMLRAVLDSRVPLMFIVGKNTDTRRFNTIQPLLTIEGGNAKSDNVTAQFRSDFILFDLDEEWGQLLPKLPPLQAPFGKYATGPNARVLFNQKIGRVDTDYPLVVYGEVDRRRMMILTAEGLWRWKLYNYLEYENWDVLTEWITQSVQYLSAKSDNRKFRASTTLNIFGENQTVPVKAELYNEAYELINEPEVSLRLFNTEGESFDYVMERENASYELNINGLPPGSYSYVASTQFNGNKLEDKGRFTIKKIEIEGKTMTADFKLLRELSAMTGGQFVDLQAVEQLSNQVSSSQIKPVLFQSSETKPLLHWKWLFALLVLPLLLEWFLRRYHGSY